MARLLDVSGVLQTYNDDDTTADADRAALASDLLVTGDDLRAALQLVAGEQTSVSPSTGADVHAADAAPHDGGRETSGATEQA